MRIIHEIMDQHSGNRRFPKRSARKVCPRTSMDGLDADYQRQHQRNGLPHAKDGGVQARTRKNQGGTVKYAEKAVESSMKDLQATRGEEEHSSVGKNKREKDAAKATCQRRHHESRLRPNGVMSPAAPKRQPSNDRHSPVKDHKSCSEEHHLVS